MQIENSSKNLLSRTSLLIAGSLLTGILATLLTVVLKRITEFYEVFLFDTALQQSIYFLIFPIIGFLLIYVLRQSAFRKKENKGITEVLESVKSDRKLPFYKIPSHFINGFLTVVSGGSTGIEVSTVVGTAAIGSAVQKEDKSAFRPLRLELLCAGVAAGVTVLFSSPIAGMLFAIEVISRRASRTVILSAGISASAAAIISTALGEHPLFVISITQWHYSAFPYFMLLGILAGLHSVYLTRTVISGKLWFSAIDGRLRRIIPGAAIVGAMLMVFPALYGDGYHAVADLIKTSAIPVTFSFALTAVLLLVFKPLATSLTLAAGGDGGVFAPSLFSGAFLGFLVAQGANAFFGADLIVANFVLAGMAAALSASIHAPLTALFLACGIAGNYTLFFPVLAATLTAKVTAKSIFPFTVYSFKKVTDAT